MMLIVFSRVFLIGACYGLWLNDDPVLKCVGVFMAIGFILDLVDKSYKLSLIHISEPTRHESI